MPQNQDKLILQDKRPVLYDDYESLVDYDESIVEDCISSLLGGDVFVEPCEMTISGGKFKALSGKGFYDGHFFDVAVDSYCTTLTTFPNFPGTTYVFYFYMDDIVDYNDNNIILLYEKNNFIYDYKKTIKVIGQTITPDSLSEAGGKLKVYVNSLFQSAAEDHSGQTVQIWLNTPVLLDKDVAIERCVINFDGGGNYIETVALLGQSSPASTTPADYSVALLGLNWTSGIPPVDCIEICSVTTGVFSYTGQSASDSINNIHDSLGYAIEDSIIYGLTSSKAGGMLVNISEGMVFSEGRHISIPAFSNFDCSGLAGSVGWIILKIGSFTPTCVTSLATYDINTQILAYVTAPLGSIDKLIDCRKMFKLNRGARDYVTVGQVTDGETLARANFANPYGALFYNTLRNNNTRPLADIYLLSSQDISAMTGKLSLDLKTTIYGKGSSIVLTGDDATNVIAVNASQCKLENFKIKNNAAGAAIKITDSLSDIQIRRIFAPSTTLADYFVYGGSSLKNISIEKCDFYYKKDGISIADVEGINIDGNFVRGLATSRYGINIPTGGGSGSANGNVKCNFIYDCDYGIRVINFNGALLISNNYLSNMDAFGIYLYGQEHIIVDNIIEGDGNAIGIMAGVSSSRNIIKGNSISSVTGGIRLEGNVSYPNGYNIISNNIVKGFITYGIEINSYTLHNVVNSNNLEDDGGLTATYGIYLNSTLGNSEKNTICGNNIKVGTNAGTIGIYLKENAINNSINGNNIETGVNSLQFDLGADDNIAVGNYLNGANIIDGGSGNLYSALGVALNLV